MAAPITHLVYAQNLIQKLNVVSKKDFYIGNSFPDIRYLGVIDRSKTHFHVESIDQIIKLPNDFQKGIYLHNYLDICSEDFLIKNNLYDLWPDKGQTRFTSLKIYEDRLLFKQLKKEDFAKYFLKELPEELQYEIEPSSLAKWHTSISAYIKSAPNPKTVDNFCKSINVNSEKINHYSFVEQNKKTDFLQINTKILELISNFTNLYARAPRS